MGGYKRVSLEETETTSLISEEGLSVTKPLEVKYHHTVHIIGSLVRLRATKNQRTNCTLLVVALSQKVRTWPHAYGLHVVARMVQAN